MNIGYVMAIVCAAVAASNLPFLQYKGSWFSLGFCACATVINIFVGVMISNNI